MAAQKEEEDRKANHAGLVAAKKEIATLTATIETKVTQQGGRAVEVESLKNDVADTQRSLDADQELAAKLAESRSSQSSEWKERQESSPGEGALGESRTSRVNTIHPAPEIHEHFMIQKGYGTLCISSCTTLTILRPL